MVANKPILFCVWGFVLLLSGACDSFLDVQPKDQFLADRVFKDSATIRLARLGIFEQLAADDLYGGTLTMGALDVMAQYYDTRPPHVFADIQSHNYESPIAQEVFVHVWQRSYQTILNLNTLINGLKNERSNMSSHDQDLLLGEVHGLRAYLHFDLLRLFGSQYSMHADSLSIPYNLASTPHIHPFMAARDVVKYICADLDTAKAYLSEDPIRKGFHDRHTRERFNYFAAVATLARVHQYTDNQVMAARYAQQLLDEHNGIYTWGNSGMFESEIIFSIPVEDMPRQYNRYFNPQQSDNLLLRPSNEILMQTFHGNVMDMRYRYNWAYFPKDGNRVDGFLKYLPPVDFIPLLRLSEMYLILAECADNETEANAYLTALTDNRAGAKPTDLTRMETLHAAFRQEFWGEGQLFYFYKRLNKNTIPDGTSPNNTISMSASKYVVPLPQKENQTR